MFVAKVCCSHCFLFFCRPSSLCLPLLPSFFFYPSVFVSLWQVIVTIFGVVMQSRGSRHAVKEGSNSSNKATTIGEIAAGNDSSSTSLLHGNRDHSMLLLFLLPFLFLPFPFLFLSVLVVHCKCLPSC